MHCRSQRSESRTIPESHATPQLRQPNDVGDVVYMDGCAQYLSRSKYGIYSPRIADTVVFLPKTGQLSPTYHIHATHPFMVDSESALVLL